MQHIELSEMTNRLRRNLMGSAFLIIVLIGADLKVNKVSTSGMELQNLSTEVLLIILHAFLLYHAVAFSIRAFEEYRLWELNFTTEEVQGWSSGVVQLAEKLKRVSDILDNVTANSGLLPQNGQTIFTQADAEQLKAASEAALQYGKRLDNFPTITRVRFWFWDIGVAGIVTGFAVSLSLEIVSLSAILSRFAECPP